MRLERDTSMISEDIQTIADHTSKLAAFHLIDDDQVGRQREDDAESLATEVGATVAVAVAVAAAALDCDLADRDLGPREVSRQSYPREALDAERKVLRQACRRQQDDDAIALLRTPEALPPAVGPEQEAVQGATLRLEATQSEAETAQGALLHDVDKDPEACLEAIPLHPRERDEGVVLRGLFHLRAEAHHREGMERTERDDRRDRLVTVAQQRKLESFVARMDR